MKAINEELERIIKLNGITKRENILYGSNEAKVTGVSPTARGVKANFDGLQYFFFYFDEKGITLFRFIRMSTVFCRGRISRSLSSKIFCSAVR